MALFECGTCRQSFHTKTFDPGRAYACPRCRVPLNLMEPVKPPAGPDDGWPAEARASTHRLGRFALVRELGRGAMGTVYKAWDPSLGRWVAIKVLQHVAADAEGLERFRREAAVVASLDHPSIASVHDVIDFEGRYAIVMKFIDGRTLEEIFRDFPGGTSSIELVVRLIRDAALGLGYAHARGFVHRDLKPGNLMVDREGKLYVLDFGLAKVLARSGAMTDLGRMMGTPAYMSPEQAMGLARDVDPRSDVFSLGSTLWALLAGQRPFQGKGDMDVARAILRDPTPSIRARRPGVSDELDLVLRKAMHREREGRYPTGVELAAALNECLLHEETARESGRKSEPIRGGPARGVVLMIEDESAMVAFIQGALARDPLDVVHYVDGMAALDAAAALAPAVVLLDVNLPGLSGWEILERLRKIPSFESTPIIMVTGEGSDEDIVRGFQLGADDYIVKPFSPTVFRARVRHQLLRHPAPPTPPV